MSMNAPGAALWMAEPEDGAGRGSERVRSPTRSIQPDAPPLVPPPDPARAAQCTVPPPVVERILSDGDAAALLNRDDRGPGGDGLGVGRERAENHHPTEKKGNRRGAENARRASGFHENLRRSRTVKDGGVDVRRRNNGITMGRATTRVNRPIGGPPVGQNIAPAPVAAAGYGPPRHWMVLSDERIDVAAAGRGQHGRLRRSPSTDDADHGPRGATDRPSAAHRRGAGEAGRGPSSLPPRRSSAEAPPTSGPAACAPADDLRTRERRRTAPLPIRSDPRHWPDAADRRRRSTENSPSRTTAPLMSDDSSAGFTDFPSGDAVRRNVTYYGVGCLAERFVAIELHSIPAGSTAPLRRPCAPRCDPILNRTDTPRS